MSDSPRQPGAECLILIDPLDCQDWAVPCSLCSHTAAWALPVSHTQGRQAATDQNSSPVFTYRVKDLCWVNSAPGCWPQLTHLEFSPCTCTQKDCVRVRLCLTDEAMDPHRERQETLHAKLCPCLGLQITHGSIFVPAWI